ncbi:MAG: L-serine ammonia-lyase, iron-sulfur-dependent subunit beta [Candidatus Heimdallarchaeota archaeon]|nr:L-serine ammonia-lyase, iron-sulfur-dependent subunit beta [Candidatus Heimdallarchaeota archaeon]MCK5158482.1 L-serine ammonia-lyase, iron-sulfur-dependent subunit beta [Candidatus Heimdallarchaeota archaeon]
MTDESVFRLLGPIMVGPSSSHTAGAVRIGRTARLLYGKQPEEVDVYFHGSFADTWRGHGSDKAIIGGLLGFKTFDERIKEADKYAKEAGLKIRFKKIKLGKRYHPNSIKIVVNEGKDDSIYVIAESVGGGDIVIREIMGFKTEITGSNETIILRHGDLVGTLSKITGAISSFNLNILTIRSKDIPKKDEALTTIEIEEKSPKELETKLKKIDGMKMVRILPSLTEGEEMF